MPRKIKELGPQIKKAIDEISKMNQSTPTVKDIADYLSISEEEVLEAMEMGKSYQALSVDRSIEADSDGNTVAILDLVGDPDDKYKETDYKLLLEKILPILSEREQNVLKCTFFNNMSQKETGEQLGISQMHVSRIQRRALRKLREAIPNEFTEVLD